MIVMEPKENSKSGRTIVVLVIFITFPADEFYVLGAIAGCSGTEQNVTPF